jgi:hypothetical protein
VVADGTALDAAPRGAAWAFTRRRRGVTRPLDEAVLTHRLGGPRDEMTRGIAATVVLLSLICVGWCDARRSLDGFPGPAIGRLLGADTTFAKGYSDEGFAAIQIGMSAETVRARIGDPIAERWLYSNMQHSNRCPGVYFENTLVASWTRNECELAGIRSGMRAADVERQLGNPNQVIWLHSRACGTPITASE